MRGPVLEYGAEARGGRDVRAVQNKSAVQSHEHRRDAVSAVQMSVQMLISPWLYTPSDRICAGAVGTYGGIHSLTACSESRFAHNTDWACAGMDIRDTLRVQPQLWWAYACASWFRRWP